VPSLQISRYVTVLSMTASIRVKFNHQISYTFNRSYFLFLTSVYEHFFLLHIVHTDAVLFSSNLFYEILNVAQFCYGTRQDRMQMYLLVKSLL